MGASLNMKVLLLGLGRANMAVAQYLLERSEALYLYEDNLRTLSDSAKALLEQGAIKMYQENKYDLVIASPGFPPNKEILRQLGQEKIPIIDEVEFTYGQLKNPKIIAVTGTNGKSTTASLISNILNVAGISNFLGGNISPGKPFSQALFSALYEYYVLEISSFQLMRIKEFRPKIAVLTNISKDHLNWHRNFAEYKEAKSRIFSNQGKTDFAVLNFQDETTRSLAKNIKAQVVFFDSEIKKGVWINGGFHYDEEMLFANENLPLLGKHNLMNIAAAICVAKILELPNQAIEQGIRTYKSLPHRLEDIGTVKGVRYINNSMCTNESAAIASFLAIPGAKIVIAGGKQKGDQGTKYLDLLIKDAKACILLGDNAQQIAEYFKSKKFSKFEVAQGMNDAVKRARSMSVPGDTILLNPGYASFDFYRNFEERGEAFRNATHRN